MSHHDLRGGTDGGAPTGRPVRVVSLSFSIGSLSVETAAAQALCAADGGADLIVLPETWPGNAMEPLDGPAVTALRAVARKANVWVVCPIYRDVDGARWNTAVLIDRAGDIAGLYDKVYPYWSEFDLDPPCAIGGDVPVFDTDFGKVGIAVCFDVNFPGVWERLAEQGAELVVWPSAYSAGTSLQAHALNHHVWIVTATSSRHCQVYDLAGRRVLNERCDDGTQVSRTTIDLDAGIYHQNFNVAGRSRLLADHADDIAETLWLDDEQWFVLQAKRPGVSARALAKAYGLEELRDYKARTRRQIDAMR